MSAPSASLSVACVSVSSSLGGSERVLQEFAARAPSHGITPTVILPKPGLLLDALAAARIATVIAPPPERLLAATQRAGFPAAQLPIFARDLLTWSRAIERALPGGVAVVYSNGFKAHLACARLPRVHRVWHLHEFPPAGIGPVWRLLAGVLPHASIAVSAAVANAWRLRGLPHPTAVLNGVDLERFAPAPRTYGIHDRLGLPRQARLVGMPAVFARWKGQHGVIEAFERAAPRVDDAHLVIVGGPIYDTAAERGYAEEVVRRVRRASHAGTAAGSLTDRIHFLRFDPEPWRLLPEFDVAVHFSTRPEPFGRVIVEALACGVPVIAADAGGPREIVEHGVSGWLVRPNDVAALAETIVIALGSDLSSMRLAARQRAESAFSANRQAASVAAILKRVAARPG